MSSLRFVSVILGCLAATEASAVALTRRVALSSNHGDPTSPHHPADAIKEKPTVGDPEGAAAAAVTALARGAALERVADGEGEIAGAKDAAAGQPEAKKVKKAKRKRCPCLECKKTKKALPKNPAQQLACRHCGELTCFAGNRQALHDCVKLAPAEARLTNVERNAALAKKAVPTASFGVFGTGADKL